jgi:hypothetical protein
MKVLFPLKALELREIDGVSIMKANNCTKPDADK